MDKKQKQLTTLLMAKKQKQWATLLIAKKQKQMATLLMAKNKIKNSWLQWLKTHTTKTQQQTNKQETNFSSLNSMDLHKYTYIYIYMQVHAKNPRATCHGGVSYYCPQTTHTEQDGQIDNSRIFNAQSTMSVLSKRVPNRS